MTATDPSHIRSVSGEFLVEIDTASIAGMVRDGSYYQKARAWYSSLYHAPIAERCYFTIVIILAVFNTIFAVSAFTRLLPIREPVPFTVLSGDVFVEHPSISTISSRGEDVNQALLRHLVKNYVTFHEEYDLTKFERDLRFIQRNSRPEVYLAYRRMLDSQNPSSPILRYERHSTRDINVVAVNLVIPEKKAEDSASAAVNAPRSANVTFEAVVRGPQGVEKTQWGATVTFDYTPIVVNQETGAVTPMQFIVSGYESQEKVITESQPAS